MPGISGHFRRISQAILKYHVDLLQPCSHQPGLHDPLLLPTGERGRNRLQFSAKLHVIPHTAVYILAV